MRLPRSLGKYVSTVQKDWKVRFLHIEAPATEHTLENAVIAACRLVPQALDKVLSTEVALPHTALRLEGVSCEPTAARRHAGGVADARRAAIASVATRVEHLINMTSR